MMAFIAELSCVFWVGLQLQLFAVFYWCLVQKKTILYKFVSVEV